MTDAAELAFAVLTKVGDFVKKLPADQLQDLVDGTAKLELVPKGGRPASTRAPRTATAVTAADPVQVRAALEAIDDRGAALRYIGDLGLTVAGLKKLALDLRVTTPSKVTKPQLIEKITERFVGGRLDDQAILGRRG